MLISRLQSPGAVWAEAFDDEVGRAGTEAVGESDVGHAHVVKTEGLLTTLAEEVGVHVLVVLVAVAVAELVLHAFTPTLDDMHQVVFAEKSKGTENTRFVDGKNLTFQLSKRHGIFGCGQRLGHYNAVGRGLHTMLLQQFYGSCFVHSYSLCTPTENRSKPELIAIQYDFILSNPKRCRKDVENGISAHLLPFHKPSTTAGAISSFKTNSLATRIVGSALPVI